MLFHPAQDTGYHILLLKAMIFKELFSGCKNMYLRLFKQEKMQLKILFLLKSILEFTNISKFDIAQSVKVTVDAMSFTVIVTVNYTAFLLILHSKTMFSC